MPAVPYLTGGVSPLAENWEPLFSEFDRKLSAAQDNHSLLFIYPQLGGASSALFGKKFFFLSGTPLFCNRFFTGEERYFNYDHSVFTNAVAATPVFATDQIWTPTTPDRTYAKAAIIYDKERKLVRLHYPDKSYYDALGLVLPTYFDGLRPRNDLLHFSLQAHVKPDLQLRDVITLALTAGGTGYDTNDPVTVSFTGGGGFGATATASVALVGGQWVVTGIVLTDGGYGYTSAPTVGLVHPRGTGATATATVSSDTRQDYHCLFSEQAGSFATWETQKIYEQVELILEGVTALTMPLAWDKYKFFRLHNFNNVSATVTFTDGPAISVPAYGSRCVRRDNGTYTDGYNHFQKQLPGDPRIFDGGVTTPLVFSNINARSNNVFNPKLIADICVLLTGLSAPHFNIDTRQFWNAKDIYCNGSYVGNSTYGQPTPAGGYFGDPDNAATLLGDLMYHKGKVLDIKITGTTTETQEIVFNGFASIVSDFAAAGITVAYDANGELTMTSATGDTRDLIGLSTNLMCDSVGLAPYAPALQIRPGVKVMGCLTHQPLLGSSISTTTTTASWSGGSVSFPLKSVTFASFNPIGANTVLSYSQTLSDLQAIYVDSGVTNFTSPTVLMTGFGPLLICEQANTYQNKTTVTVGDISGSLAQLSSGVSTSVVQRRDVFGIRERIFASRNFLDEQRSGMGWPSIVNYDLYRNFFRVPQFYGMRASWSTGRNIFNSDQTSYQSLFNAHPDFTFYLENTPASDSAVRSSVTALQKPGIAFLSQFSYYGNKFIALTKWRTGASFAPFGTGNTSSPDWYRVNRSLFLSSNLTDGGVAIDAGDGVGTYFDYFPLMIDTYNNLASLVNGITSVVPLHFGVVFPEIVANTASPFVFSSGTCSVRPFNQFAGNLQQSGNAALKAALQNIDVTINTKASLPASYAQLFTEKNRFATSQVTFNRSATSYPYGTVNSTTPPSPVQSYTMQSTVVVDSVTANYVDGDDPVLVGGVFHFGEGSVNTAAAGKLLNSDWRLILFGTTGTVTQPSEYSWVKIEDVAAVAATLGLKFYYQVTGLPSELKFYEDLISSSPSSATGPMYNASAEIINPFLGPQRWPADDSTATGQFGIPLKKIGEAIAEYSVPTTRNSSWLPAKSVAFVPSSTPEWIQNTDSFRVRQTFSPASLLGASISIAGGSNAQGYTSPTLVLPPDTVAFKIGLVNRAEFLRRNWAASRYQTQPLHAADKNYEIICFRNTSPVGNLSQVVKIPEPTLLWGPSSAATPVGSIPATLDANASLDTPLQIGCGEGNNFIIATSVCERLQFFIDNRVSV